MMMAAQQSTSPTHQPDDPTSNEHHKQSAAVKSDTVASSSGYNSDSEGSGTSSIKSDELDIGQRKLERVVARLGSTFPNYSRYHMLPICPQGCCVVIFADFQQVFVDWVVCLDKLPL